jgi:hypothetical protein
MTLKCYYLKLEATEIDRLRNGLENNMEIDNIKIGEKRESESAGIRSGSGSTASFRENGN